MNKKLYNSCRKSTKANTLTNHHQVEDEVDWLERWSNEQRRRRERIKKVASYDIDLVSMETQMV